MYFESHSVQRSAASNHVERLQLQTSHPAECLAL